MEEKNISYLQYESSQARMERTNRRMWILCIILIVALIGTNSAWLYYESQFMDTVTVSQEVETNDSPAYVNGTGSMTINGESETDSNKNKD